jgi:hypothetical protein
VKIRKIKRHNISLEKDVEKADAFPRLSVPRWAQEHFYVLWSSK